MVWLGCVLKLVGGHYMLLLCCTRLLLLARGPNWSPAGELDMRRSLGGKNSTFGKARKFSDKLGVPPCQHRLSRKMAAPALEIGIVGPAGVRSRHASKPRLCGLKASFPWCA